MNRTFQELSRKININSFVIGHVATKRGLDSTKFMSKLMGSMYSAYNGFSEATQEDEDNIKYPSDVIYDWTKIKQDHRNNSVENYEEAIVIDSTTEKAELKNKLKERFNQLKKK